MLLFSCKRRPGCVLVIKPVLEQGSSILLERLGYNGHDDMIIDSIVVAKAGDTVRFNLPDSPPCLYRIRSRNHLLQVTIVNDAPEIFVRANFVDDQAVVKGSPSYNAFERLKQTQIAAGTRNRAVYAEADSLKNLRGRGDLLKRDSLLKAYDQGLTAFFERYITFADTVKNPALFMQVFPTLEFRNNFKRQKAFMLRAASRFESYEPIQELKRNVLELIRIYEVEYQVGQKLPNIVLPDDKGVQFNTATLKGKYYLIDFWSSFCDQCLVFKDREAAVRAKILSSELQFISVALDDDKAAWAKLISNKKRPNWTHIIDVKRFQGPTVKALAFDSIPYNLLISPEGTIIRKAIPADSLFIVLKTLPLNK